MKKIIVLAICGALSAFGTSLADGETNESNRLDGQRSNANFRQWDLGGGLTMDVRAFQLVSGAFTNANTTQFGSNAAGELGTVATIGLGVCGGGEDCDFNQWQIDNADPGGRDFVLFTFSIPVNLVSFTVRQTRTDNGTSGVDSDWAYFVSANAITTLNGLNTATGNGAALSASQNGPLMDAVGSTSFPEFDTRQISTAVNVRSILIGAGTGTNDYFKLYDITVANPIPEPSSMVLLGGGLIGLTAVARKRGKKS